MKFFIQFSVSQASAEKIGIDLKKRYLCNVQSQDSLQNFVSIYVVEFNSIFVMEVKEINFINNKMVFHGWLNYNSEYLCQCVAELFND